MTSEMRPIHFHWRTVRQDEAKTVYTLHLQTSSELDPSLVRPDPLSHFIRHTEAEGIILGGFVDKVGLVAYGVLGMSSDTASHLAHILDIDKKDRARFCILDGAASLAAWRGHGLHRTLIQARIAHAQDIGRTLIGATVAPDNIASMRGLLKANFQVTRFSRLYGGFARLVLKRDLLIANQQWVLDHKVLTTDIFAHQSALAEGLIGFSCSEHEDRKWRIHYGHVE